MEFERVSVVIPVYNVEKYLNRCIESVVNQTYQNIEIILVDDGSLDKCPKICDEWRIKDPRIRVIHKENAGLGNARNTGIDSATGEYICFFDSDDYVLPHTLEHALRQMLMEKAQLAVFGLAVCNQQGKEIASFPPAVGRVTYRNNDVREVFLPEFVAPEMRNDGKRSFYMSSCVILYSMALIKRSGWRFASEREIISEDVYSLLLLMKDVETVTIVPEALYCYCQNSESLSRSYKENRYAEVRNFYICVTQLCDSVGYSEDIRHRVSKPYLAFTLSALKQEAASGRPIGVRWKTIKEIIADPALQTVLHNNRRDVVSKGRKIMFFLMRKRMYLLCFVLLRLKASHSP